VDPVTESMIRSVLAYAENRLRLDPVSLDGCARTPAELDAAMKGLLGDEPHNSDQVLGVYTSVMAPAVLSADSPRFLGFIPAAPTKASLLFDMLISCASIQGISWLEAAGAVHAENLVLRLIADRAGLPPAAGGCFVSGGSAANLSALVVAREAAKRKAGAAGAGRRWRVAVGQDAHSSIVNSLRILEMDPLIVRTGDHRVTGAALRAAIEADGDPG
jgi:glutamate/tyrosine decarboxylase-like PLP-dependent enzyme